MNSLPKVIVALFAVLALCNCSGKSEQEKIADELIGLMNDLGDSVAGVKDEASAEKAAAELVEIAKKIKALQEKAEGMSDPPKDVQERVEKNIQEAQTRLEKKMEGISGNFAANPAILQKLGPALMEVARIMGQ